MERRKLGNVGFFSPEGNVKDWALLGADYDYEREQYDVDDNDWYQLPGTGKL